MRETDTMLVIDGQETLHTDNVTEIAPLAYGNQEAKISYQKQLETGELTAEIAERAAEIVMSGECMREVNDQDDGCIDGRPAVEVLFVNSDDQLETRQIKDATNHERAKVAGGGGYMTSLAMKRALDFPADKLDTDLASVADLLTGAGVYCGAHTGQHSHGEATDCGANDKFQAILNNGVLYRAEIAESTKALLGVAGVNYDQSVFDTAMNGWTETLTHDEYFEGSTGGSRFGVIEERIKAAQEATGSFERPVAVSKHLAGDHKEDFIVLNYMNGKTFSQQVFADKLADSFPDTPAEHRAQAFVVDVWRIVELAKTMTSTRQDAQEDFQTALYGGVAYQLATAATLTDGTLRNFIVSA